MKRSSLVVLVSGLVLSGATATGAAVLSDPNTFGDVDPDRALVYFIRGHHFTGSARTMFVYADDTFLGTVDDDGYTFAYVEPGTRLLWLNWARINRTVVLEPGRTYWFDLAVDHIGDLDESDARARIAAVAHYCTPTEAETETSAGHILGRKDKAEKFAKKETGEFFGTRSAREKHVAAWPKVDLSRYSILVVEDFAVTDPKAKGRKRAELVVGAPARMARLVQTAVDPGLFREVRRGRLDRPDSDAVVLRVEVTQYKPGSEAARLWVGAGAGSARLDFVARLIDGATGAEIATFADERAWGWGGAMGAAGGIETIERNLAHELSVYLRERTGRTGGAPPPGERIEFAFAPGHEVVEAKEFREGDTAITRFVVHGASIDAWTEGVEIVERPFDPATTSIAGLLDRLRAEGAARCPDMTWSVLREDDDGALVETIWPGGCQGQPEQRALRRILLGEREVFQIVFTTTLALDDAERGQWIDALTSARVASGG